MRLLIRRSVIVLSTFCDFFGKHQTITIDLRIRANIPKPGEINFARRVGSPPPGLSFFCSNGLKGLNNGRVSQILYRFKTRRLPSEHVFRLLQKSQKHHSGRARFGNAFFKA